MLTPDSLIHSGNPQIETYTISSNQKIERKDLGNGKYEDTVFVDNIPVFTLVSEGTHIAEAYIKYQEEQAKKMKEGVKVLPKAEKAKYMRSLGMGVGDDKYHYTTIDIATERKVYPDIDMFLDSMVLAVMEWEGLTYEEALEKHFVLDEEAKKHIKRGEVEGIIMNQEELAEKVGDLYYDALAAVLSKLSETLTLESKKHNELDDPSELDRLILKASQNLQEASIHIMTAWEICKPFLKAPLNPKHTSDIQGIPNATLGERIGKLNYGKLAEFLKLLGEKIHKDGLADEGRGRKKLATELFEAAKRISVSFNIQ
ncbi:MAG: hypothetical protein HHAS10_04440 [Candidatus Altimarinota bacterium]